MVLLHLKQSKGLVVYCVILRLLWTWECLQPFYREWLTWRLHFSSFYCLSENLYMCFIIPNLNWIMRHNIKFMKWIECKFLIMNLPYLFSDIKKNRWFCYLNYSVTLSDPALMFLVFLSLKFPSATSSPLYSLF